MGRREMTWDVMLVEWGGAEARDCIVVWAEAKAGGGDVTWRWEKQSAVGWNGVGWAMKLGQPEIGVKVTW